MTYAVAHTRKRRRSGRRDDLPVLFLQHQDAAPKGTGIIIPVRHAETVFDLTAEESATTLALLRDVKAWMDDAHRSDGYTVGWNCGLLGGQEIVN